jgi:protein involved in polysaccharide export with SLBB domain
MTNRNLVALIGLALLHLAGCAQKDNRIDVARLRQLEQHHVDQQPVLEEVPLEQLALTDVRPYRYVVDDELLIEVAGLREEVHEPELLRVRVRDGGSITMPGVGQIQAEGLTAAELEQKITDAYVPSRVKRPISVFVELQRPQETTVLVTGSAMAPGLVRLRQNQRNVLYALAAANGFVEGSSGEIHVVPARPGRPALTYNLRNPNDVRSALLAPPLESGDTVVVRAAQSSVVYLTGLVNVPGPIPLPLGESVSLVRAVAAAGGLVDFLEPQEATLWRKLDDGKQVRVKLDMAKIMVGEEDDIALLAGDVLDVPHTAHTRFRQWFAQNIRFGPFGVTAVYDPVADYRARILRDDNNDNSLLRYSIINSLGGGITNIVAPPQAVP